MVINPIRLNWHYVIWYRNFAGMVVSLVVPFVLLAYWNFNTLLVLLRRRRLRNRPQQISLRGDRIHQEQYQENTDNAPDILPEMAAATLNAGLLLPRGGTSSTFEQGKLLILYICLHSIDT